MSEERTYTGLRRFNLVMGFLHLAQGIFMIAISKRRISNQIHSDALAGDAVSSITCAYMAGTVLIGLLLNFLLGWWWIEDIAALVFLIWLGRETREAFEEAHSR
jgi:divalent metal cation (Fe/Co/Zn/Cd) transporter